MTVGAGIERRIERLVNAHRRGRGLVELTPDPRLAAAARQHAQRMRNLGFFDHRDPFDGTTAPDRVNAAWAGRWSVIAENLAAGQRTADEVLHAWLTSPSHRANVEDGFVTHVGTAVELHGAFATYTTQLYAREAPARLQSGLRVVPCGLRHWRPWAASSAHLRLNTSRPPARWSPTTLAGGRR